MVELTVVDLRVQLVLGCLGAEAPRFSQGALQEFRERLIAADLDRRVLERTVELAKRTKAFDHRKLPKTLRVAIEWSRRKGGRQDNTVIPAVAVDQFRRATTNYKRLRTLLRQWEEESVKLMLTGIDGHDEASRG